MTNNYYSMLTNYSCSYMVNGDNLNFYFHINSKSWSMERNKSSLVLNRNRTDSTKAYNIWGKKEMIYE